MTLTIQQTYTSLTLKLANRAEAERIANAVIAMLFQEGDYVCGGANGNEVSIIRGGVEIAVLKMEQR